MAKIFRFFRGPDAPDPAMGITREGPRLEPLELKQMFRAQLPRFYELKDLSDPSDPRSYFRDFEGRLQNEHILQVYLRWERELQRLDPDAWNFLKDEAKIRLLPKEPDPEKGKVGRGWQQLFDILGQAFAYNHVKESRHWSEVRFIPPKKNQKTPDLEGTLDSQKCLCEVKTLNTSDNEVEARQQPTTVRNGDPQIGQGLLNKLDADIAQAKRQMGAYDSQALHLVYVIVCFDEFFGIYRTEHLGQIRQHLLENPPGVEIEFGEC
jgi:hypothetical protein